MSAPAAAVSDRLRVAVLASNAAAQDRLATLVAQCGHQLVEATASPDAVLTDGAADAVLPAAAVAAGLTVRATPLPSRNFDSLPEEPPVLLTPREIEVLGALGNGMTNKEVARLLGISPHTVKFHIESLFRKLGAASRAEAVAKGIRQQIVEF